MSLTTLMLSLAVLGQVASSRSQAAGLERGTTAERLEVLADILDVPPSQREPDTWRTMQREATRMLSAFRTAGKDTESETQGDLRSGYAAGLARGLGESGEPAVIPTLVQLTGLGRYAMDAAARFGDLSVPELLRVARGTNNDLGQENGAAGVMALLLHEPTQGRIKALSNESRRQIAEFAGQLLDQKKPLRLDQIFALGSLAIETGRLDLRREVERLANDTKAWEGHGVTTESSIQLGQNMLRYRLSHPLR